LPDNIPALGDRCEVLAAYRWGGCQHKVLAQLKLGYADGGWDEQYLEYPGCEC
jgi:hypothetical protein